MATWADTTFSTTATIARMEAEINSLTSGTWADKIALAKELLKIEIQSVLIKNGKQYWTDFENGEILVDIITNKEIFNIASDYKVLQLIYEDLSHGNENSTNGVKAKRYGVLYESALLKAIDYAHLDIDHDGSVDEYKPTLYTTGTNSR